MVEVEAYRRTHKAMQPINMESSFRVFVLRFAATAVLFAPAAAAQALGIGQSVCRDVWDWGSAKHVHVCNSVYYPPVAPQPPPQPEPPVKHTTGYEESVRFDPAAEARKAQCGPPSIETSRVQVCARHPTGWPLRTAAKNKPVRECGPL